MPFIISQYFQIYIYIYTCTQNVFDRCYLVMGFKELDHLFHVVSVQSLNRIFQRILKLDIESINEVAESYSVLLTSTNPKKPELISPAGNPIAIIFSVMYVISKSNSPS